MQGLLIQLQVVHALILREMMTRFGKHRLGYLWAFIEPLLWIGMFAAAFSLFGRLVPPGMGIVSFLTTGLVPFQLFRNEATRNLNAISANKNLLFYPRVRPLDLVFARSILEFATSIVVFTVLMTGDGVLDGKMHVDNVLLILLGFILAASLGIGLGMLFCALSVFSPSFERIMSPLIRPLFWISGIFYTVESLPSRLRELILYNPLVHAIQLVRGGCFEAQQSHYVSIWYPAFIALVLLFSGLTLERVVRRRIQLT